MVSASINWNIRGIKFKRSRINRGRWQLIDGWSETRKSSAIAPTLSAENASLVGLKFRAQQVLQIENQPMLQMESRLAKVENETQKLGYL